MRWVTSTHYTCLSDLQGYQNETTNCTTPREPQRCQTEAGDLPFSRCFFFISSRSPAYGAGTPASAWLSPPRRAQRRALASMHDRSTIARACAVVESACGGGDGVGTLMVEPGPSSVEDGASAVQKDEVQVKVPPKMGDGIFRYYCVHSRLPSGLLPLLSTCQTNFSVAHGGRHDVVKHVGTPTHTRAYDDAKRSGRQARLFELRQGGKCASIDLKQKLCGASLL